jgi:hypothetical protein
LLLEVRVRATHCQDLLYILIHFKRERVKVWRGDHIIGREDRIKFINVDGMFRVLKPG